MPVWPVCGFFNRLSVCKSQEECELLESAEISHHKKLCIQLKRAERKVLQNALKYASTTRNKTAESGLESDRNCDIDTRTPNDHVEDIKPQTTNTNASDEMGETACAVSELSVDGE